MRVHTTGMETAQALPHVNPWMASLNSGRSGRKRGGRQQLRKEIFYVLITFAGGLRNA